MKKSNHGLRIILLLGAFILLFLSYMMPWAVGSMALVHKTVYASSVDNFIFLFIAIAAIALAVFLYGWATRQSFRPGMILLITGGFTILMGWYALQRIKDKELAILGIDPLTVVSTQPKIGVYLFFLAGGVVAFAGLVYLFESLKKR